MKFEYLPDQELIPTLKEVYSENNVTHLNLREYYTSPFQTGFSTDTCFIEPMPPKISLIEVEDFSVENVQPKERDGLSGVTSIVRLNSGLPAHLPQLESDKTYKYADEFLEKMGQVAEYFPKNRLIYVASTGRGYHFYGTKKMEIPVWEEFMKKALLEEDLFDNSFVSQMWHRGYSNLRLTTGFGKKTEPKLIGRIIQ